jgi:hypothetical protein
LALDWNCDFRIGKIDQRGRFTPELVHTRNHGDVCVAEVDPSAFNEPIFPLGENDYTMQY